MASKVKGGEKVVDVLIKSGADPDTSKEVCCTPLHPSMCSQVLFLPNNCVVALGVTHPQAIYH